LLADPEEHEVRVHVDDPTAREAIEYPIVERFGARPQVEYTDRRLATGAECPEDGLRSRVGSTVLRNIESHLASKSPKSVVTGAVAMLGTRRTVGLTRRRPPCCQHCG
jgi:hypothetical protein